MSDQTTIGTQLQLTRSGSSRVPLEFSVYDEAFEVIDSGVIPTGQRELVVYLPPGDYLVKTSSQTRAGITKAIHIDGSKPVELPVDDETQQQTPLSGEVLASKGSFTREATGASASVATEGDLGWPADTESGGQLSGVIIGGERMAIGRPQPRVECYVVRGDTVVGKAQLGESRAAKLAPLAFSDDPYEPYREDGAQPLWLVVPDANRGALFTALPLIPGDLVLTLRDDDNLAAGMNVDYDFEDFDLNDLLYLLDTTLPAQVGNRIPEDTLDERFAERKLMEKMRDPAGAALGALALLRFNRVKRLHDWTRNLSNWFPKLADGPVTECWRLLNLDNQNELTKALDWLEEALKRGPPVFQESEALLRQGLRIASEVDHPVARSERASKARKRSAQSVPAGALNAFWVPTS